MRSRLRLFLLRKALTFATEKHKGHLYNHEPFIFHPILVAQVVELIEPWDDNLIASAYLHDILEDTETTFEQLTDEFDIDICNLVKEVTKTDYNTYPHLKTRRGVILLTASRLCNIASMKKWDEEKQLKYIDKTRYWKS